MLGFEGPGLVLERCYFDRTQFATQLETVGR
jgi:hypothetical protein